MAYFDKDPAEYYISTGTERTGWNSGRTYRNDGVDIKESSGGDGYYVTKTEDGEWLRYTVFAEAKGNYKLKVDVASERSSGMLSIKANGSSSRSTAVSSTGGEENWKTIEVKGIPLQKGANTIVLFVEKGGFNIKSFKLVR